MLSDLRSGDPLPESVPTDGDLASAAAQSRSSVAMRGSRQLRLLWAATVLGLIAMAPFGEVFASAFGACPIKSLVGIPCPSCGATRSAMLLAELRVVDALSRFPMPTLGWIGFMGGGLAAGVWVLLGRELPAWPRRLPGWAVATAVGIVLAGWAHAIVTGV
ncbi:MAG: DUF2752 domain-containing protein [Acidobacteriota bacterium]